MASEATVTLEDARENMRLAMSDHHAGKHDWSSADPYDCTVCDAAAWMIARAASASTRTDGGEA